LTTPLVRAASTLTLAALSACTQAPHPIEAQLARMQPVSVAALTGLDWPAGTLLCPLTPYQSSLPAGEPTAERVNSYLRRQRFVGEEGRWSLVVVKPGTVGDDGIEHLLFKRGDYDIVTAPRRLQDAAEAVPAGFRLQSCVPLERARVLATRARATQQVMISFGTE
jgi:hypothetical protein